MKVSDAARGKWRGILIGLGVNEKFLTGKHGPCPFCEGVDRFRWDNDGGKGSFYCNQCGAGDGFAMLMRLKGWDFKTAAKEVEQMLGHVSAEPPKKKLSEADRVRIMNDLWKGSSQISEGDLAWSYLSGRSVLPRKIPACLAFHNRCPVPFGGGFLPAMLAIVSDADGNPRNIHRTFLGPKGKAEIEEPRAMMPGELPDGCAVRLYPVHGERLGIAEGIETAIAAAKRFNIPVWAALNSTMLGKWIPPHGVSEIVVFGDNDPKFGGQSSAFALAHRLATRNRLKVSVEIPETTGRDWADAAA